jgi:hypothetical protein
MTKYAVLNKSSRHEDVWGSGGIAPCILKSRHEIEVSGQLHASAVLFQGMKLRYTSDRRLGGRQSRCGRDGEEKNSLPLLGIEPRFSSPQPSHYTD